MVPRHLKIFNYVSTYLLYDNIYTIKFIKFNMAIKWIFSIALEK
jgi:hypothetical protein